ncbi:hypothetical protein MMC18_004228 [Xylographa bjoerkii]|nr:hypothetical protein [Xylographa bjoerkii]
MQSPLTTPVHNTSLQETHHSRRASPVPEIFTSTKQDISSPASLPRNISDDEREAACIIDTPSNKPLHDVTNPPCVPQLKRKRGLDTRSATITNTNFGVFKFDQDMLEVEAEEAEQPKTKKVKLHNKKQIITGSGDIEYIADVCEAHASKDISLPLPHCAECRRVSSIIRDEIDAYEAWLPFKHDGNKTIHRDKAMHRWRRTRRALANYKLEVEDAQSALQRREPPLDSPRPSPPANPTQKSVQFDPSCLNDGDGYRKLNRFDKKSFYYQPGKYSAPKGESWENISDPYEKHRRGDGLLDSEESDAGIISGSAEEDALQIGQKKKCALKPNADQIAKLDGVLKRLWGVVPPKEQSFLSELRQGTPGPSHGSEDHNTESKSIDGPMEEVPRMEKPPLSDMEIEI